METRNPCPAAGGAYGRPDGTKGYWCDPDCMHCGGAGEITVLHLDDPVLDMLDRLRVDAAMEVE